MFGSILIPESITTNIKCDITQQFGEKLEHFIENRKFYFLDKSKQVINIVNSDTYEIEVL